MNEHDDSRVSVGFGCRSRCTHGVVAAAAGLDGMNLNDVTADVAVSPKKPSVPASTSARARLEVEANRAAARLMRTEDDHPVRLMLRERFGIGLDTETASQLGIGLDGTRLRVTVRRADGSVAYAQARATDPSDPIRWLGDANERNDDGTSGAWDVAGYVGRVTGDRDAVIVEGPTDGLTLAVLDSADVVAVRGAKNGARAVEELTESLRGRRVYIAADADDAGRAFTDDTARALSGVAGEVLVIKLPTGKDVNDTRMHNPGTFEQRWQTLVRNAATPRTPRTPKADGESKFNAANVVSIVEEAYELSRAPDGWLYATPKDPRQARRATEVGALRPQVTNEIFRARDIVAGSTTMAAAFDTLRGIAASARTRPVHLRATRLGGSVHIDCGGRDDPIFIEVTECGWKTRRPGEDSVAGEQPIFQLSQASRTLPEPAAGGSRDDLRELLCLGEDDTRWRLIWGWLVASFIADVPRPILWVLGSQGSGKSTRAKMILNLIDPVEELGAQPGKSERDDSTAAYGRFVPSYDNVGRVSAATSDWLCRLVTGVAVDRRGLYTDDELRVRTFKRTAIATSVILPYGLGPDALERLTLVEFERMPDSERRSEEGLWTRYREMQPRIFGALLDDLAGALRHLPALREAEACGELAEPLPRMADYALVLHALDAHTDHRYGFARTYTGGVRSVMADKAASDPLTAALVKFVRQHEGEWAGQSGALLQGLAHLRPDDRQVAWPHDAASLGRVLSANSETLRAAGLVVVRSRTNRVRNWHIRDTSRDIDDADVA